MTSKKITILPTGTANIASVRAGFERLGCAVEMAETADAVAAAAALVLPGVGAFAAAMQRLHELRLVNALADRIGSHRKTLAICLGLQLLCQGSEESPGVAGLAVLPATVARFPGGLAVPQMGWNEVVPDGDGRLLRRGHAYFANSYFVPRVPETWSVAVATHGVEFVAAIERGSVLACQFHPELSGSWGAQLLQRWLAAPEVVSC